jgi:hypothetical protein
MKSNNSCYKDFFFKSRWFGDYFKQKTLQELQWQIKYLQQ